MSRKPVQNGELKIFTGGSNPALAKRVCRTLRVSLGQAEVGRFSDGETKVHLLENVRGTDCFIIQSTCQPVNDNLMELLVMVDAASRSSANRITVVLPYYGYARQDRKHESRVPITAKLVADLITASRASRVLTLDLHAGQIQGFFNIPVDNLYSAPVILSEIKKMRLKNFTIVAPDVGRAKMARAFARLLHADLAIVDKRRPKANVAQVMNVIGEVRDKNAVIVDDMIDTGGTLTEAAQALVDRGALKVYAFCTHAVLSGDARERIRRSPLEKVIVSDSIPVETGDKNGKIGVVSVAPLVAKAIRCIHNETSVSSLFPGGEPIEK
jgi:ribose-phosphate pyrophosphokinase